MKSCHKLSKNCSIHVKNCEIFGPYNLWTSIKNNTPDVWNWICWTYFGSEVEVGEPWSFWPPQWLRPWSFENSLFFNISSLPNVSLSLQDISTGKRANFLRLGEGRTFWWKGFLGLGKGIFRKFWNDLGNKLSYPFLIFISLSFNSLKPFFEFQKTILYLQFYFFCMMFKRFLLWFTFIFLQ